METIVLRSRNKPHFDMVRIVANATRLSPKTAVLACIELGYQEVMKQIQAKKENPANDETGMASETPAAVPEDVSDNPGQE